jgi:DNA mismatch repair protein MutS2
MKSQEVEHRMSVIKRRTLQVLEWPELCRRLAEQAMSPLGAGLCLALMPEESGEMVRRQTALTTEMADLLQWEGRVPLVGFADLRPVLLGCGRGERLTGPELRQVGDFLGGVGKLRAFLMRRGERCPSLVDMAGLMQELASLRESVDVAIDGDGHVREDASPGLKSLRRAARHRREAILGRLDGFVRDRDAARVLQDAYYTVREGRFVLPVRADSRGSLGGIVHDISASGATHFLEPPWLVEMNNELRVAELEVQKELERILEQLSAGVAESADVIGGNLDLMAQLDLVHAKARLSRAIGGTAVPAGAEGEWTLRGLRHPLLALREIRVIPSDLFLEPADRILVISGPNAGGKTVLLKAVGLAALMVRAGMHVPADEGSRLPFLPSVFADIGDQQDIQQDVSTFSGHMRNIRDILAEAKEDSLVILDELAGSTDPQEGAALALAILDELDKRGCRVLVTTHYPQLKAWGQGRKGARNGAMEFDWERMAPTYRLRLGIPGQSSALEVARRMGLPEKTLESAAGRLRGDEIRLEALLREIERQRSALEEERRRDAELRVRLEEAVSRQELTLRAIREEKEAFRLEKRRKLAAEIQEARQRIRDAMKDLAAARRRPEVDRVRAAVADVERDLRPSPPVRTRVPIPLGRAHSGDAVEILALGQKGVLLDDPATARRRVRVQVGAMEVLVEPHDLGGAEPMVGPAGGAAARSGEVGTLLREVSPEIDLRGMRVEDALEEVERYLDQALLSRRDEVRVIHGHGTGALKKAVRQWLSGCSWIGGFRAGARGEGGDGATVVLLKRGDPGSAA